MHRTVLAVALALAACGGSPAAPETAAVDPAARRVDVLVSGAGYTPDRIEATAGEALTLVFLRADAMNCGEELVFRDTDRKVVLPVGEKVEVAVTAPASGELAFTCGMGMYDGRIVLSAS